MGLVAGARLGPYEILSSLGAGGMGEVYRARDTRLDRLVAIKVLPAHLSENSDARARFQREARAISGLTHPHICTLHDVGHQEGVDYLVMELLEGGTLADRLDSGPLPLEQVFRYGTEIADALERAHRAGVVHRDLKPGNVMVTKSGVKLLDFGLARMSAPKSDAGELSALPTAAASRPLTEAGTVMGTVQYMAPEQLEGKEADARTDIFALGCILYEMATGKKAFSGASHASLITAIMSGEPAPISSLAPMTPPALDRLVRICLAKDPDERWQSAHDVKSELQWIAQAGSQAGLPAVVATRRKSRERQMWAAALVAAAVVGAAAARLWRRVPASPPSTRFDIQPVSGDFIMGGSLSPDGRTVAFASPDPGGTPKIWLRALDSIEPRPLAGAGEITGLVNLAWSPDGRSLAVPSGRRTSRVDIATGTSQPVSATQATFGLSWGSKGDLVFVPFYGSGIQTVRVSGGTPSPVTTLDRNAGEVAHLFPRFLPDGRRFLFFIRMKRGKEAHEGWIASSSLDGRGIKRICLADGLVGAAEGRLVFTIAGVLYAQAFDMAALAVRGEPVAIQGRPLIEGSIDYPNAELGGPNLLFRSDAPRLRRLVWVDRTGRELAQIGNPEPYERRVSISRDGRRALVMRKNAERGDDDIWSLDLERGTGARSGSVTEDEGGPVWSPDGTRYVFDWDREGPYDLAIRQFDGSRPDEPVARSDYDKVPEDWSKDGRFIVYRDYDPKAPGIKALALGENRPAAAVPGSALANSAQISPDGRWILWMSSESGRREIYVQRFPDGAAREQVSVDGSGFARWNPNGKEIFFLSSDAKLMSVTFDASGDVPTISRPKPLFAVSRVQLEEAYPGSQTQSWDVAPDGQRFLLLLPVSERDPTSMTVVLNWASELEHAER